MAFCRFCGSQLEDGQQCSCQSAPTPFNNTNQNNNVTGNQDWSYTSNGAGPDFGYREHEINRRKKEPFFAKGMKLNFTNLHTLINSFRVQTGVTSAVGNDLDPFEYNVPIVPGCVEPEENEVPVKQYNIAKLRTRLTFTKAEGRLMVTNRRIIFRAAGTTPVGNILQEHQFNLDEVTGLEIHQDNKFSKMNLIFCAIILALSVMIPVAFSTVIKNQAVAAVLGLIFGFALWIPVALIYKHKWFKFLSTSLALGSMIVPIMYFTMKGAKAAVFIFGLIFLAMLVVFVINTILTCFEPSLKIQLKVRGGLSAIEVKDAFAGYGDVLPWEDTVMAINELGTLIEDLQKQGDYAIAKWTNN